MSKPVWGSPIYPNSIKEHPGSCINAWRGRIYRVTRPMHKHRDLWPFLSRLNPVWEKCGRGNGIKFLRGGAGLGKTLPMGPRTKSDLEWRRPRRWTKKMKTTSSATTPAAASRVWRTHAVMTAGGSIGAHDLPLAPPRDFLFLFCCSNWFMYRTQSARRLAFGFSFIPALAVIFLRRFY